MRKRKEKIYSYEAIFEPNGEGYTVTVPKLPGLVTEGKNLREATVMAKDAIRCYLGAVLREQSGVHRSRPAKDAQRRIVRTSS